LQLSADFLQSFAINPQLMDYLHSNQIGAVPGSPQKFELEDKLDDSTPIGLSNNGKHLKLSGGSSPSKSSTWDDQTQPTTYNPLYGLVEGVKCGSTDWSK
jgi:hypothetical protein